MSTRGSKHAGDARLKTRKNKLPLEPQAAIAGPSAALGVQALIAWAQNNEKNLSVFYTKLYVRLLPPPDRPRRARRQS